MGIHHAFNAPLLPGGSSPFRGASVVGVLEPCSWCPGDRPPPPPSAAAPPLLVLLDRRAPRTVASLAELLTTLSAAERQRHAALRRPADQERFLVGRAALRQVLGQWLGRPPAAVVLETGTHGKPHCPGAPAFNLSHSGALILLAFQGVGAVGVDVERLRSGLDWRSIAARVFPPTRVEALASLPAEQQPAAFLQAWCRLEARLKARGEGMAGLERLRRREVAEDAGDPAVLGAAGRDILWDVRVPPGYGAALAWAAPLTGHPVEAAEVDHPSPLG